METYVFFKDFGLILIVCKLLGVVSKKFNFPSTVGYIIGGLLLGPTCFDLIESGNTISLFGEIGVLLIMFSTGLETDLKSLTKTGPVAFMVALIGVIVPFILGSLTYFGFYGFASIGSKAFYSGLFIGLILTATSVSITVSTLKELGKINTTVGTTIVSAAIIDDVMGIIALCIVQSLATGKGSIALVLIKTVLFFIFAVVVGVVVNHIMKWLDTRYEHTQRIPVLSLALCFIMAYIAETFFGISDLVGAYITGLTLCTLTDASYITKKIDISAYMLFAPVFFANIGLQTQLNGINESLILFTIAFVLVALIAKIIGCGLVGKIAGHTNKESLIIGVGMMTRGEVALIVAQKGLSSGLVASKFLSCVVILIIVSSLATPVVLKMLYKEDSKKMA